jgi:hypothetical protein
MSDLLYNGTTVTLYTRLVCLRIQIGIVFLSLMYLPLPSPKIPIGPLLLPRETISRGHVAYVVYTPSKPLYSIYQ